MGPRDGREPIRKAVFKPARIPAGMDTKARAEIIFINPNTRWPVRLMETAPPDLAKAM